MENTTNNSFEEQWQKAFDDASLPPSEAVWEKIELGLENKIPPKSGNGSYYVGAVTAVILGIALWFFIGKKEIIDQVQILENKTIIPIEKIEQSAFKTAEKLISKTRENVQIKKMPTPKKEEIIEPEIIVKESENEVRTSTDSVDFMNPIIITKKVNSELVNPGLIIPFEQVPYYEVPKPVFKKKSIWDKVKFSGSVGIYQ